MIKTEDIIKVANYFTIIAHTPGRLRVRVNPKIKEEKENISINDIEDLSKKIEGINKIIVKQIIASVTIIYDPNIFPPKLWENLIKNENLEEITELINRLAKKVA